MSKLCRRSSRNIRRSSIWRRCSLKAHEDKTVRGANIASLTVPWGGGENANENTIGGYHLVWSRDLYQVATAFMALGDKAAAMRALDFLFKVQQKPDGSFPQNSWLDGKPFWGSLQLDEVAYPLILAYQLGGSTKRLTKITSKRRPILSSKTDRKRRRNVGKKKRAIRLRRSRRKSPDSSARPKSPSSTATKRARDFIWRRPTIGQRNVEKWTATTNGKYGDGNYYLRITQNGKPDAGEKIELEQRRGIFRRTRDRRRGIFRTRPPRHQTARRSADRKIAESH